ncbi:hypothetical protein [Paenibacillus sp. FSL R7-0128]|uniref:hypothetical protein n=1 Tax=Paenibacillus sp. FSL R7-0128 TaxID=2954529 RepID=UPI0030F5866B
MAKYTASPHYSVAGKIEFGFTGVYETEDTGEIATLDALVPIWIKRIDAIEPEADEKSAPRQRKTSGK